MNSLLIPLKTANYVSILKDTIRLYDNDKVIADLTIKSKSYSKQYELTTFRTDEADIECSMDLSGKFGYVVNINLI